MASTAENNKRIAKNTAMLYIRMLLIMAVTLYTSRVVLEVLGVEDFGIYNVVGGVVALFSMFSGSLSSAISRFLTFELGKEDQGRLATVFSSAVSIQLLLSAIIFIIAEFAGCWFLNNRMNIPVERLYAANWVLQFSIFTFIVNLIAVPYNAAIIAHEHMKVFAYISVIEVVLKLIVAFLLYSNLYDGLILYSSLLFIVAIFVRLIYGNYCRRHFQECKYRFIYDRRTLIEMASFAGWNFIGVTSGVLRDHGVNIILNLFCGPMINAARAISVQVGTAINTFVSNFMTALNPQIIKSYATGDNRYMMELIFRGARYSYYLLLLLSIPILVETEIILSLWLKFVPEHTIYFVRLMLIWVMSESLSLPLITAMFATGKIRNYQIVVGGIQMMNFPISYIALYYGAFPEMTVYISIILSQICLYARLFMLRQMINLSVSTYVKDVYLNILFVSIIAIIAPSIVCCYLPNNFTRFVVILIVSTISTLSIVYILGCSTKERDLLKQKLLVLKYNILKNDSN